MLTIEEYTNNFKAALDKLEKEAPKLVANLAVRADLGALALIQHRIQYYGIGADGNSFGSYSTKPMLVTPNPDYWKGGSVTTAKQSIKKLADIANKSKRAKKKRGKLNWKSVKSGSKGFAKLFELEGGYEKYRELNDLQTGHIDLSFRSGNGEGLWDNITTSVSSSNGKHYILLSVESSHLAQYKGLSSRFGELLKLTEKKTAAGESETKLILDSLVADVIDIFKQYNILIK